MEKEQKQELGWRVSVLPIPPAFHHCEPLCVACTQCTVEYKNWDGGYLYYPFLLHSTTVSHYVLHVHSVQWNAGMGNTIPILVSVLFPSLHLTSLYCECARNHTHIRLKAKPHPHRRRRRALNCWLCLLWSVPFLPSPEVLNSC